VPAKLFFSYAHEDQRLRDGLESHLSILKNNGEIESWHDHKITAGSEWAEKIDDNMRAADVVLLLVSSDFLASRYCSEVELRLAMERHERGEAVVIPVILRPVEWKGAPFGKLQACPTGAKPITKWSNRDEAYQNVVRAIREAVHALCDRPPLNPPPGAGCWRWRAPAGWPGGGWTPGHGRQRTSARRVLCRRSNTPTPGEPGRPGAARLTLLHRPAGGGPLLR
jgi:TIR domain